MSENETNDLPENEKGTGTEEFELEGFGLNPVSSAEVLRPEESGPQIPSSEITSPQALADTGSSAELVETDPVFAELAAPALPELPKENRARLQMQTPNRLYFYWSVKNNPFQTLHKVFGPNAGSYQLVVKLVNQSKEREEIYPVEAEGNWWFNVEAGSSYRAEIGFYASNRPYIRLLISNTVETPRKSPSPRAATDADWAISTRSFVEVLDASGFKQDAFEVALAGDDAGQADTATQDALWQLIGQRERNFRFDPEEVRLAILALASGASLEELRGHISEALFIFLQEHAGKLSVEAAVSVLEENFDVSADEIFEEEQTGPAVYGASRVHFPKTLRKRTVPKTRLSRSGPGLLPRLSPVSSFRRTT